MMALVLGLITLGFLALGFILYAFRLKVKKIMVVFVCGVFFCSAFFLYYRLGYFQAVKNAELFDSFNYKAEHGEVSNEMLVTLIEGLNTQLKHHPDDPITAALLGKIYFSVGDYVAAEKSFARAYASLPDDPELLIDYATAYYLARNGEIETSNVLLEKVKALPPSLASLSLLANVAWDAGDRAQAIAYWQQMQTQIPQDSALYQELTEMIIQAESES